MTTSGPTPRFCAAGGVRFLTASPADLAALRRAVQPVYGQLERDPPTRRYVQQIEAMAQKELPPEPAPGCGHTARPGKAGPLNGVWRFTTTPADLRAAGETRATSCW